MSIPWIRGHVARQAHVGLPEGTCEEEYARGGFSGTYAHLYRTEPPVGWSHIEGPLRPRAFDLREVSGPVAVMNDPWTTRIRLLENEDVRLGFLRLDAPVNVFARNADADEVFFVHAGGGRLESDFGPLDYRRGDYLLIPRGTVFRFVPSDTTLLLTIATRGEVTVPERGLLGQHALFDPAIIEVPTPPSDGVGSSLAATFRDGQPAWDLKILRHGAITTVTYPFCPLNTVGWKGTLSVRRLNVDDIRPVMSERYHLPPSAHATFVADGVIICSFLPRPLENGDPAALKVPFYHSNIDFDEVLFYHAGTFFSRTDIGPGMVTLHPAGIHHGPQPGAAERARGASATEEVAIMIDTRRPLAVCEGAERTEKMDYWQSWGGGR